MTYIVDTWHNIAHMFNYWGGFNFADKSRSVKNTKIKTMANIFHIYSIYYIHLQGNVTSVIWRFYLPLEKQAPSYNIFLRILQV